MTMGGSGIDETAAGLALGMLEADERAQAREREARDPAFKHEVETIERRLAPLAAVLPSEGPPPALFAAIEARIDEARAALPGTITLRAGEYDWQPLAEGIDTAILWRNDKVNRQSMLIRMQPGAHYESHSHEDDEECLVIEGDLVFGGLTLKAGDFHFAPKGRMHPPAYSPSGCLLYVISAT